MVSTSLQHDKEGERGWGDEVRQVKICSNLACAQKRQKCKFVLRLFLMIVAWALFKL